MSNMRKSRLSKGKQDRLIEHFVAGTTARCAADLINVNRKTAIYYFHRLREIVAHQLEQEADTVFKFDDFKNDYTETIKYMIE